MKQMTMLLLAGLVAAAPASRIASPQTPEWEALALSDSLRSLLAAERWDATPHPFQIVTLSFLADGCVAEARRDPTKLRGAQACVTRALEIANGAGRRPPRIDSDDGLWLTHYALILGAADELGACPEPKVHQALAAALALRTLVDPHRHAASYMHLSARWPADETATLAALARHDRAHGTHLLDRPAREWKAYVLASAMDRDLGLPWSEVSGSIPTHREPRGCALSWQTRFLHEVDDPLARQWWAAYRDHFAVDQAGFAGFREWAPGRDLGMDADSGPILAGVGAAATGLGIAAARVMGETELADRIERTASVVGVLAAGLPGATGPLPDAIRYLGAQIR